jgi:hypothetical protein
VRITGLGEVYLVIGVNGAEQLAHLLPIVYAESCSIGPMFMEAIPGCGPPRLEPEEQTAVDGALVPLAT